MINYYLEELAADGGEIETEEELNEQKQVVEKVVDKLIYQDQVRITSLISWLTSPSILCSLVNTFLVLKLFPTVF